jgi:hypothetical protein
MQFRIITWAGYVSVMEEARNLYNIFVAEPQERTFDRQENGCENKSFISVNYMNMCVNCT